MKIISAEERLKQQTGVKMAMSRAQGKKPKVAIVAVMRKLLVILNSKMRLFSDEKHYF
jgi:hypothetical protein